MPRKTVAAPEIEADVEIILPLARRGRSRGDRATTRAVARATSPAGPTIPRITRIMALAIKFQDMVDRSEVADYADLARLGYVTRARLTQIMNLTLLAPDIQEAILMQERAGARLPNEHELRAVAGVVDWVEQRRVFGGMAT